MTDLGVPRREPTDWSQIPLDLWPVPVVDPEPAEPEEG